MTSMGRLSIRAPAPPPDFEGHPLNAVVVRKWAGKDYGRGKRCF